MSSVSSSSIAAFSLLRGAALLRRPLFITTTRRATLSVSVASSQRVGKITPFLSTIRCASTKVATAPPPKVVKISADDNLKRVLESEIKCAQESQNDDQGIELQEDFPFEIVDIPGDQTITLRREYGNEIIQVHVFMNLDGEEEDLKEAVDDDSEDDNNENPMKPTLSLVATIAKGEGPTLEFSCNLNSDALDIEGLFIKKPDQAEDEAYQGPAFSDLDHGLQKAMHKYLEVRGIKSSLFDSLHEYMMDKDDREYVVWLKNMKEFIEK